ncbi:Maf family protein [Candidatus Babeliales bacterium]|nr:Maf family protein [Candidatus Babeliales bacterium]
MGNQLLIASGSKTRHELLFASRIPFTVLSQEVDESQCEKSGSLEECVTRIAHYKMDYVNVSMTYAKNEAIVLTADTLGMDAQGVIHGKPVDRGDAVKKIKALRGKGIVGTAFCLEKRMKQNGGWASMERVCQYVEASYVFDIPDNWIDAYLDAVPGYYSMSGAITIEGYGSQFLKSITGSYSTILGLPLFELRQALERIGFFN